MLVLRSFAFVAFRSWKNRLMSRLKRLREPRYLLSMIAAGAYFWFFFFRRVGQRPQRLLAGHVPPVIHDVIGLLVLALGLLVWVLPNDSALAFSEGEIQFLFSAPLTRRQTLLYKIIRGQPQLLVSTCLMFFFRFTPLGVIGFYFTITLFSTYVLFVALARAWLRDHRFGDLQQFLVVLVTALTLGFYFAHAMHLPAKTTPLFTSPLAIALIAVPRFIAETVMAPTALTLAIHVPVQIAAVVLLFLAGTSIPTNFEDLVSGASQRHSERKLRMRGARSGSYVTVRRVRPPFRLRPTATPEMAIFWKNLTASVRISGLWFFVVFFLVAVVLGMALLIPSEENRVPMTFIGCAMVGALLLWGPMMFPQDLRLDLNRIDILKSWPVSGERIVQAALAAPLLMMTLAELILIGNCAILISLVSDARFSAAPQFIVIGLLFAVPLCAAQLLVVNTVPLLFPAWATRSKEDQRGPLVIGQRLVALSINLVALGTFILPAAIASVLGFLLAAKLGGGGPFVLAAATMPGAAILAAEVWYGSKILGSRFDRLDPSTEMEPVS